MILPILIFFWNHFNSHYFKFHELQFKAYPRSGSRTIHDGVNDLKVATHETYKTMCFLNNMC